MNKIYLSSLYLPPIQYFTKLMTYSVVYTDPYENYIKQSYRNRCNILSANGMMPLSIPVEHASGSKICMKDVRIASHGSWQHLHWNALISAYNSSPFFEYYADDFYPFYHSPYSFLFDFNEQIRDLICRLLAIDQCVQFTDHYIHKIGTEDCDYRNSIHPKKDWLSDTEFAIIKYYQVFEHKNGFIPNASIVDLLFNMGPESLIILNESILKPTD